MSRKMSQHEQNVIETFVELGAQVRMAGQTVWLTLPGICEVPMGIETAYEWATHVGNCTPWQAWLPSAVANGEGVLAIWQRRPAGMEV